MKHRIEKIVVEGKDAQYEDFDLPEGGQILKSYLYNAMAILYVAVPANKETAE